MVRRNRKPIKVDYDYPKVMCWPVQQPYGIVLMGIQTHTLKQRRSIAVMHEARYQAWLANRHV